MSFEHFFLGVSWMLMIKILWFNTDAVVHYAQLFGLFESHRTNYTVFLRDNPVSYFPDYLYTVSLKTQNRMLKFFYKLISCPFCIGIWLSMAISICCCNNLWYFPMFYITSIGLFYFLRKFVF